jgi:DNA-dependent RNA polymerase auxiliary subunit epsilon
MYCSRRIIIVLFISLLCIASFAQKNTRLKDFDTRYVEKSSSDSIIKVFSNSEPEGVTFLVSTNVQVDRLFIKTNYTGQYNVRFIDYWGRNHIDFENVSSDFDVDLKQFDRSIFVMNISDEKDNKLISSQIINLKRRNN